MSNQENQPSQEVAVETPDLVVFRVRHLEAHVGELTEEWREQFNAEESAISNSIDDSPWGVWRASDVEELVSIAYNCELFSR